MRKLLDYFWAFVRKGQPAPYEHGPAKKFTLPDNVGRDEIGRWVVINEHPVNLIAKNGCGDNCTCKDS